MSVCERCGEDPHATDCPEFSWLASVPEDVVQLVSELASALQTCLKQTNIEDGARARFCATVNDAQELVRRFRPGPSSPEQLERGKRYRIKFSSAWGKIRDLVGIYLGPGSPGSIDVSLRPLAGTSNLRTEQILDVKLTDDPIQLPQAPRRRSKTE